MFQNEKITDKLPSISELEFKPIHKNYLIVQLFNFGIISCVFFVGLYFLIDKNLEQEILEYTGYLYLVLGLILCVILFFLILGFYKRKYAIREYDVSYEKGVLVYSVTTVPYARIQHIELEEKPFSRLFKLASLKIYTAGESGGDLKINGLPKKEAKKIKEFITHFINE